jgi:hypothetical protein
MPTTSASLLDSEPLQSVPQQQHQNHHNHLISDHEATKLLSSEEARLSPNLFLNLNFDNSSSSALDPNAALKFEWSNFNPTMTALPSSTISMSPVPISSNIHSNKISSTPTSSFISSPTYEFLNVDQFNMDNFKNECILNLDHNLLNSVSDASSSLMPTRSIDLNSFSLDDTKELLDLEKPININDKF